ncbi:lyase family protein [Amnibacterium kyonggiense]|uniref:3-carboxy-cis,cis-muconate cycloisomerase n=1 Tax=Amnibacterium kyonggiense TaxID=595671 RepID=A0A4V3EAD4_9MICO|nr:lyase family protein [Amnibacterium kyonggiense]TDS74456.1 3-carboxy-cis,cis-muconate cycloisomerase [Amnibacterium kyonggiense]
MTGFDSGLLDPTTGAAAEADDRAVLRALVDVEAAHLEALVAAGVASGSVRWAADEIDLPALAAASASGGNPVIPLVAELRRRTPAPLADAVHLGLTSQDVLDSALMLVAARSIRRAAAPVGRVLEGLAGLAEAHRTTPVAGRTLGRQAAPTTAGLRLAVLLDGVARTRRALGAAETPLQLGGSVGTLAVLTDRLGADGAEALRTRVAAALGLAARPGVWHVERSAVSLLGAAVAAHLGALGRLGLEAVQGSRPELGELELAVGAGEGGSSAMPQKQNPVAAVLLVANARRAPGLAATLLGSQLALDERPAGDWHAEWQPLRELLRLLLESAVLAERLVAALDVDAPRSRANLEAGDGSIHAERAQQVLAQRVGRSRAAELTRTALAEGDFVAAIRRAAVDDPDVDEATRDRLAAATTTGGTVGLSDRLIDASVAAARGVDR